ERRDLLSAEEQQVGRFLDLSLAGGLDLDAARGQDVLGQFVGAFEVDGGVLLADLVAEEFDDALGSDAGGQVFGGGGHVLAGGSLPGLGGGPSATYSAVCGGLGASGVVPVEVARRDGLDEVDVDDGAGCGHVSSP